MEDDFFDWGSPIPLPLYSWWGLRKICICRRGFWTRVAYQIHYSTRHLNDHEGNNGKA